MKSQTECLAEYGSDYMIQQKVNSGELFKIGKAVYSEEKDVPELAVLVFIYSYVFLGECLLLICPLFQPHLPYNGRSHSDQNSAEMIDFVLDNLGGVAGISLFFPVKGKIIIFHRNGFVPCGFSCAA